MRKLFASLLIIVVVIGFTTPITSAGRDDTRDLGRKIVIWKDGVDVNTADTFVSRHTRVLKQLPISHASVIEVSRTEDLEALASSPDVLRIDNDPIATIALVDERSTRERDQRITALFNWGFVTPAAQVTPWGVATVTAPKVWPSGNTGDPIKVGVIDTGISSSHPDLKANIKGGINTINAKTGTNDDNGHGSHVAGIVAALNNTQGVVGVAPNADLYAIKVLNSQGSGYYSDIIEGIQWAVANRLHVVNMSLGGTTDYPPLHDAIIAAKNAGVIVVAAAGNNGGPVIYPAAYPETIAVSATDASNSITSWSSRGPQVDVAAPGANIYSTYKGTGYSTLSGTSMASPHAAGVVALMLNTPVGLSDTDGNSKWSFAEVLTKLKNSATDLGVPGFDNLYGSGLVNAAAATK